MNANEENTAEMWKVLRKIEGFFKRRAQINHYLALLLTGAFLVVIPGLVLIFSKTESVGRLFAEVLIAFGVEILSVAFLFFTARMLLETPDGGLTKKVAELIAGDLDTTGPLTSTTPEKDIIGPVRCMDELDRLFEIVNQAEKKKYLEHIRNTECLLEGHFELLSGDHSSRYLMIKRLLMNAAAQDFFIQELENALDAKGVGEYTWVLGPERTTGSLISTTLARKTKHEVTHIPATMNRREPIVDERLKNRINGEKCIYVDDLTTTGTSATAIVEALRETGINVVAAVVVLFARNREAFDRARSGWAVSGVTFITLGYVALDGYTYKPGHCPLCRKIDSQDLYK